MVILPHLNVFKLEGDTLSFTLNRFYKFVDSLGYFALLKIVKYKAHCYTHVILLLVFINLSQGECHTFKLTCLSNI
jgi:hypothetical protein